MAQAKEDKMSQRQLLSPVLSETGPGDIIRLFNICEGIRVGTAGQWPHTRGVRCKGSRRTLSSQRGAFMPLCEMYPLCKRSQALSPQLTRNKGRSEARVGGQ